MILTCLQRNNIRSTAAVLSFVAFSLFATPVAAQETMVLSVSPTLFEMTANPSQNWSSSVRVINANPYPISVYAEPVNFAPTGEDGVGSMSPIFETEGTGATLAEWIQVTNDEIIIPPEQTISVPFTISVPTDAAPGGHFGAILIGTRPLDGEAGLAQVETSQVVTSLVFLRVAGDIVESGSIRSFTTTRSVYEYSDASFSIRFENDGNVHVQPQGEIQITNMWGQDRGSVPVNQNSQFGNVLPESIREYSFNWTSDWSVSDIGRNKAVLSLAYGSEARQSASATTYFWVIPWKVLLAMLVVFGGVISIIIWGVRMYVRNMLQLAGVTPELHRQYAASNKRTPVSVTAPIEAGILDLRHDLATREGSVLSTVLAFIAKYRAFAFVMAAVVVFVGLLVWYAVLIIKNDFSYTVSYEQPNGTSVEIPVDSNQNPDPSVPRIGDGVRVLVVNQSNNPSVTESVETILFDNAYTVVSEEEFMDVPKNRTVIVYDPEVLESVTELQSLIPSALLSAFVSEDPDEPQIVMYLGTDLVAE